MQRLADEEAGIVGNYDAGTVHSNPNAVNKAAAKINAGQASPSSAQNSSNQSEKSAGALNWEEQKKLEAERRKKEKEVARLEDEIAKVEGDLSDLQNKMSDPAVYSNGEKAKAVQAEITSLEAKLDELNAAWELAAGEL